MVFEKLRSFVKNKWISNVVLPLLIFLSSTGVSFLLDYLKVPDLNFLIVYILGIVPVALLSSWIAVPVVYSALAVIIYDLLFVSPRYALDVSDQSYLLTFFLMIAIGVSVSLISFQMKAGLSRSQKLNEEKMRLVASSEAERSKTNFLRSISHDLKTPLTVISGGADLLLGNLSEIERNEVIIEIRDQSLFAGKLIDDLLILTKLENGSLSINKEEVPVEEVIGQSIRNVSSKKGNRIITVNLPKDLLLVSMDQTLITQVLTNILSNAIRHTSDTGKISLSVFDSGKGMIFRLINNGEAIDKAVLPMIFDMFDNHKGPSPDEIGLGLTVAKAIVVAHGGTIEARNSPDGVVFEFVLPKGDKDVEQKNTSR